MNGHGYVTGMLATILVEHDSATEGTGPVDRNGIQFFEGPDEMFGVLFANIFDAKIVDDQQESDVFGKFFPKRGRTSDRGVAKLRKVELETVVSYASVLLQTGHALVDLHVDPPIRDKGAELVLGNDLFGDYGQGHFNTLIPFHGGIVIENFNDQGEEYGGVHRHGAVDEALGCCQTSAVACGDSGEVKFVSPNRETDPMGLSLVGPDSGHKTGVSHSATVRGIVATNKNTVLVLLGMRVPMPCAIRSRLLAELWVQTSLFGPVRKWR